jgi:hypothetical protein
MKAWSWRLETLALQQSYILMVKGESKIDLFVLTVC